MSGLHRLDDEDGGGSRAERPVAALSTWKSAGRLLIDQRHDLHARPGANYDGWRQTGNAGWGWDDVLPYFLKSEDNYRGKSRMHGAGGEWRVGKQRLSWPILDAFRDAAEETRHSKNRRFQRWRQ
ncbi:hypothetical protein ATY29_00935 [Rhizobium hidalgonense]|nr:hypothetical protein ATY29_00935 [Rhizobium hidalgonense]